MIPSLPFIYLLAFEGRAHHLLTCSAELFSDSELVVRPRQNIIEALGCLLASIITLPINFLSVMIRDVFCVSPIVVLINV